MEKKKLAILIIAIVVIAGSGIGIIFAVMNSGGGKITHNLVDVGDIAYVSKYRSCVGHIYPSTADPSSSEKHYIYAASEHWGTNDTLKVYAIWDAEISYISEWTPLDFNDDSHDWRGQQIQLVSGDYIAVYFHVNPVQTLQVGDKVKSGDLIGWADTRGETPGEFYCNFDIAIHKGEPQNVFGSPTVSFFELMPDSIFEEYTAVNNTIGRADFYIPLADRTASPCTFTGTYSITDNLVFLNPN